MDRCVFLTLKANVSWTTLLERGKRRKGVTDQRGGSIELRTYYKTNPYFVILSLISPSDIALLIQYKYNLSLK